MEHILSFLQSHNASNHFAIREKPYGTGTILTVRRRQDKALKRLSKFQNTFQHIFSYSRHPDFDQNTICDVMKQNESELINTDFKMIKLNKADDFFPTLQLAVSLEPIEQFQWGLL